MRILFVTSSCPYPVDRSGASQRTRLIVDALARWGAVELFVVTWADFEDQSPEAIAYATAPDTPVKAFIRLGRWDRFYHGLSKFLPGFLGRTARAVGRRGGLYGPNEAMQAKLEALHADAPYDLFVGRYLLQSAQSGILHRPGVPAIVDMDDVDWVKAQSEFDEAPMPGKTGPLVMKLLLAQLQHRCRRLMSKCDHLWMAKASDLAFAAGRATASVLPNIPFPYGGEAPPRGDEAALPPRVLFVASLNYGPNKNGLDRFLDKVWPKVIEAVPEAVLAIVGIRGEPEDLERWARVPNTDVIGAVDDVTEQYRMSALAIAPVYWGSGTKIKVLEALAQGVAVAAAPHAVEGFEDDLRHDEALWLARDDAHYAEGCIRLLREPATRARYAAAGKAVVDAKYSQQAIFHEVDETVGRLFPQAPRPEAG